MPYSTVDQVKREFKSLEIGPSTAITDATVTEWIEEADAEIDSRLAQTFQLPIPTGAGGLVLLRRISRALVAERVAAALAVKTGDQKTSQDSQHMSRKDALALLDQIVGGQVSLAGAVLSATSNAVNGFASIPDCDTTVFKKGVKQW